MAISGHSKKHRLANYNMRPSTFQLWLYNICYKGISKIRLSLKNGMFISKLPDSGCRGLVLSAGSVFTSDRSTLFSKVKSAFKVHDLKFI